MFNQLVLIFRYSCGFCLLSHLLRNVFHTSVCVCFVNRQQDTGLTLYTPVTNSMYWYRSECPCCARALRTTKQERKLRITWRTFILPNQNACQCELLANQSRRRDMCIDRKWPVPFSVRTTCSSIFSNFASSWNEHRKHYKKTLHWRRRIRNKYKTKE